MAVKPRCPVCKEPLSALAWSPERERWEGECQEHGAQPVKREPYRPTELEAKFLLYVRAYHLPMPVCELHFHPERHWRVDFAWPRLGQHRDAGLAVEIDGGQWVQGRHQRPQGFAGDIAKSNQLARLGWRLLRFTTQDFDDPAAMMRTVGEVLGVYWIEAIAH